MFANAASAGAGASVTSRQAWSKSCNGVQDLLDSWGLEAVWVRNGREARNLFAVDPQRSDLAVLDQTMPGMTGTELIKHLLAFNPILQVVLNWRDSPAWWRSTPATWRRRR